MEYRPLYANVGTRKGKTGPAEEESAKELTALQQGMKDRKAAESRRFRRATDSEYWVAMAFASREEKEEFLAKWKLRRLGDKFLDGRAVDKTLSTILGKE